MAAPARDSRVGLSFVGDTPARALAVICAAMLCTFLLSCSSQNPAESTSPDTAKAEVANAVNPEETVAQPLDQSGSAPWYNSSMFHDLFGDYNSAAPIQFDDRQLVAALKERGRYLATGPAVCGSCHAADPANPDSPLTGGRLMQDRFGLVHAANITPDKTSGIGNWGVGEMVRAIRSSIDNEGRPLSIDLHSTYRWLSDTDVKAISYYLLTSKPATSEVERRRLGAFERKKWGMISQYHEVEGYVPAPPKAKTAAYGRYLSYHVAGCYGCHTSEGGLVESATPFAGNKGSGGHSIIGTFKALFSLLAPDSSEVQKEKQEKTMKTLLSDEGQQEYFGVPAEEKILPEIQQAQPRSPGYDAKFDSALDAGSYPVSGPDIRGTSDTGLLTWSKEQLINYMTTGNRPDGKSIDSRVCPWPFFAKLSDNDKEAIAIFLKQQ